MTKLSLFFAGFLLAVACTAMAGLAFVRASSGFSARVKPSFAEEWMARRARSMAMPDEARRKQNPIASSEEVLSSARAHWADHCASCHANDGNGDTAMGRNLYPPAPDMRANATQQLTDGELFYIIENGIRLSGMPGWGGSDHGAVDSWKLVHFIRHLPQLSFSEKKEMEGLNPKSPSELEEEKAEEQFLNGDENHEKEPTHNK